MGSEKESLLIYVKVLVILLVTTISRDCIVRRDKGVIKVVVIVFGLGWQLSVTILG